DLAAGGGPQALVEELTVGGDGRQTFIVGGDRDGKGVAQLGHLVERGACRPTDAPVEGEREADDDHLGLGFGGQLGDARMVATAVAAAVDHLIGGGERAGAHGDPDPLRAQVEAERAHQDPSELRMRSSASSSLPGSRPPATASSAFLPVPPPTSFAAGPMRSDAWSPSEVSTAATMATPPDSGALARTAPRMPGCSRTATARSRSSSRPRSSRRNTTTPSTAPDRKR